MDVEVDIRQVIYALSDALDLVGVNDFYHGKRVALMAVDMARHMGMDGTGMGEMLETGLLHDCGVSSTAVHQRLVENMDWEGSQEHCVRGHALLSAVPQLAHLALSVRYHHTHSDCFPALEVTQDVALKANLIFLADRADALAAPHYGPNLLQHKDEIRAEIFRHRGGMFSPELIDVFMTASNAEAFWLVLEPRHIQGFLGEMLHGGQVRKVSFAELRQLAMLFAYVVDAKSPYTATHSIGVARLARLLGELDGLDEDTCEKLEIAGLMHDLGKLVVPDAILEKQGPLNATERGLINRHSFETYQILRRIPGLEEVAAWAAFHHETLDGMGYPYNLPGSSLPRPARLVAVADIFQAMAQDRPYRDSVSPPQILALLRQRVAEGKLDPSAVDLVGRNLDACWLASRCGGAA